MVVSGWGARHRDGGEREREKEGEARKKRGKKVNGDAQMRRMRRCFSAIRWTPCGVCVNTCARSVRASSRVHALSRREVKCDSDPRRYRLKFA